MDFKKYNIKLIINQPSSNRHVLVDTINELESTILIDPDVCKASVFPQYMVRVLLLLDKLLKKGNFYLLKTLKTHFIHASGKTNNLYFSVMMYVDYFKLYPFLLFSKHKRASYLFDTWTNVHDKIIDYIKDYKIDYLFVSSSQSAAILNKRQQTTKVFWIPEGINPSEYKYLPFEKKTIDVLALGRKYDAYHEKILPHLRNSNKVYLYEKIKGQIIFPKRSEFINGLASTKISICVPSNITHPERAGNIETMTIRYLQSMVSKCLVVGYAPKEMVDLFGYNPVIDIDMDNPTEQIDEILNNFSDYIPLIDKNYQTVINSQTWEHRWAKIKTILKEVE